MGSDINDGSVKSPLKTIYAAQQAVRKTKFSGTYPNAGIRVILHEGRHELTDPLWFTENDSGRPEAPVVYTAAEGEAVNISGGEIVSGWSQQENGIWKAPAKGLFRQIYVNGKRAIRARTPNNINQFHRLGNWKRETMSTTVPLASVAELGNADGAEFVLQTVWSAVIMRIKSVERQEKHALLNFYNPEKTWVFNRRYPKITRNQAFHIENHLSLLDAAGEWYHDVSANVLYYKPRAGEDMHKAVVTVPKLETLIRIEGTLNHPVEHIIFRGITFEDSNWLRPSHIGVQGVQAGMFTIFASLDNTQILGRPKSAIDLSGARHITFENNLFHNLGATALDLRTATAECKVIGNVFRDIAGGPIRHGMFSPPDQDHHYAFNPDDLREVCTNDQIINNYITHSALDYLGNCGIACGFVRGVRVEHNTITDLPYTAISIGWGWNRAPNVMADNRILYNRIDKVMQVLVDGGAIYTLAPQRNSEVAYNYLTNVLQSKWTATGHPAFGIYFDEASDYLHRHHNVLQNIHRYFHHNRNGSHNKKGVEFTYKAGHKLSKEAEVIAGKAGLEASYKYLLDK